MENRNWIKEFMLIVLVVIILTGFYLYPSLESNKRVVSIFIGFILIIGLNVAVKKIVAYRFETNANIKPWSLYQFGLSKRRHLKTKLPMIWLTPILSLISNGILFWMPLLETEITPKIERVAKRHELYRFSQIIEWHVSVIIFGGLISNIALSMILLYLGQKEIATLSLYYCIWSLIPISQLDGTKLFFGSRKLWLIAVVSTTLATILNAAYF